MESQHVGEVANQAMESQRGGEDGANARESEDANLDENGKSCSSSSSGQCEFTFQDTFTVDNDEPGSVPLEHGQSNEELQEPKTPDSDSSSSSKENPDDASTLQSPPIQVMERPSDDSPYRIPPEVFARNKSGTHMEWSVTSNESLFSIQNMSFTREQFSWLLKSGELTNYGDLSSLRKSGELTASMPLDPCRYEEQNFMDLGKSEENMPSTPVDAKKSGEQIIAAHFKVASVNQPQANQQSDVGLTSSDPAHAASSPTGTDIGESNLVDQMKANPSLLDEASPLSTSVSHHSDGSCQSFAFPVLSAELDREKSVNQGTPRVNQKKKSSSSVKQQQDEVLPKTSEKANDEVPSTQTSWLSCFSCWPCR